jgi:uncharacterized LabA/DUF88 family protein
MVYIDGFNLYFGLKEKGWKCYYWLDISLLCHTLLRPDQKLVGIKYFTARVQAPLDKKKRQSYYLRALSTTSDIKLFYGKYETAIQECPNCHNSVKIPVEKMSDVQMATHLITDAFDNNFDVALVVTGDKDIVPAIEICKEKFPVKRIVSVFPPMRSCDDLRFTSDAYIHVTEQVLKKSMFPDIINKGGQVIERPKEWY